MSDPLQKLALDIIRSIPDSEGLGVLLARHVPALFPETNVAVWRFPDRLLHSQPEDAPLELESIWPWLAGNPKEREFGPGDEIPWEGRLKRPVVVTPILDEEEQIPIGGIYLEAADTGGLAPVADELARLIGAAFYQSHSLGANLRLARVAEELTLAGEIQSGLIPYEIPRLNGWQISVTLDPAEETHGDFFDFIPLGDDQLGIVIADVADKGIGAALYMALARTLFRTYAIEAASDPETVFFATNARMLADTTSPLFVTAFYGVLDVADGRLTYANAGHNPPYLIRAGEPALVLELMRTGIPIGIREGEQWGRATVQLEPGDRLVLYTDGIPEASKSNGEMLTIEPVIELAKQNLDLTAEALQTQILAEVTKFVDGGPQSDDITLMVLAKDRAIAES